MLSKQNKTIMSLQSKPIIEKLSLVSISSLRCNWTQISWKTTREKEQKSSLRSFSSPIHTRDFCFTSLCVRKFSVFLSSWCWVCDQERSPCRWSRQLRFELKSPRSIVYDVLLWEDFYSYQIKRVRKILSTWIPYDGENEVLAWFYQ